MTESDRTVQVPASLIKDADRYIEGLGLKPTSAQANWARAGYLAGRAHSLSQPTPTAEPKRMLLTHPHDGHGPDDTCRDCQPAEPPRIEDMAPGTTEVDRG